MDYGKHRLTTSPDGDLRPHLHITKAKEDLLFAANYLIKKGADAIILGCTENFLE